MRNLWLLRTIIAISGALLLNPACTPEQDSRSRPEPAESEWRGIWPQDSRDEAEQAQKVADRRRANTWQLGDDGARVVFRYAREQLGWQRSRALVIRVPARAEASVRRWRIVRCDSGRSNPDYVEISCAPPSDRMYSAADIRIERLLQPNADSIWIVTNVEQRKVRQPEPASARAVRKTLSMFLTRRVSGAGAEEFLSPKGRKEFGTKYGDDPLYSPDEGSPYADHEIVFVDGPYWPFGTFEVGVRMILQSGAGLEDTLFVGPGRNVHGEKRRVVVHGSRPGLDGP